MENDENEANALIYALIIVLFVVACVLTGLIAGELSNRAFDQAEPSVQTKISEASIPKRWDLTPDSPDSYFTLFLSRANRCARSALIRSIAAC